MSRITAIILSFVMILSVCGQSVSSFAYSDYEDDTPEFYNLGDPELLQYMEDSIYAEVTGLFGSEDYVIENISAIYYSKEYLEEVAYNSKANIFFGYTLEELDDQFQGTRYVFTMDDNGETTVQAFEDYDDTYDRIIQNVMIGSGVILVCVTVSVATGGAGLTPVSAVFAASAKTGTAMALSSGVFSGVVAGTVKGIQTGGDLEETAKAAALAGSESFKWGAITGAIVGGVREANALRNASKAAEAAENATTASSEIPTWRESELAVLEEYGGSEQLTYLAGEEVSFGTPGATRPDVVRVVGDHLEAIEVKNYNLESSASLSELYSELEREISARVVNLPGGSTQRIVLDVTGRGFSTELVTTVTETITQRLIDIYPNIPIDILGTVL
ncbi:MAG: hypothetical protein LIO99_06935 [Clostridiales bacterium]|nr:hypothetical protein [Clostridiales bacterium]